MHADIFWCPPLHPTNYMLACETIMCTSVYLLCSSLCTRTHASLRWQVSTWDIVEHELWLPAQGVQTNQLLPLSTSTMTRVDYTSSVMRYSHCTSSNSHFLRHSQHLTMLLGLARGTLYKKCARINVQVFPDHQVRKDLHIYACLHIYTDIITRNGT